jgi:RNA polymerase sigma factor (sigma-70 family)
VHEQADTLNDASDEQLLAACLRGESVAWDSLIDRYAGLIYSIPLKYGLSEADAADVFQSVCVILLEKLDTVRVPRGLAAWIITTTSRQSLSVARHRRREHSHSVGEAFVVPDGALADVDPLPEEELLGLERQRTVRGAIKQLPTNCQRLIEALFSDGAEPETYQQLAAELGVPMNSVGPTRTRCLEKLRRLLLAAGFTP